MRKDLCWCVGPMNFSLIEVDDIDFAPPYDKFYKGYGVRYVIAILPRKNGVCAKASFDKSGNDSDGVLKI